MLKHLVSPTLHMFFGSIASGKSTLAAELAEEENTVLVSEDAWLGALFSDQMSSLQDFVRCSAKIRAIMGPHVAELLNAGVSVVLDFHANTVEARNWMRGILDQTNAAHQLHVLNTPDEVCLERLRERNAKGEHPFAPTEEQFCQIAKHIVMPTPEEGFNLVFHEYRV